MRPRIVLHVGPHKTGSTYLQKRIFENLCHLREQGIFVPKTGWIPHGHHKLVDVLRGWVPETEDCSLAALRTEISGSETTLITSENFVLLEDQHLAAFRDAFNDFDIFVIFFLRHPVNIWPSHWQELVKHGSDITFAEYMLCIHGHLAQVNILQTIPNIQIRRLSSIFGINGLKIVVYENVIDAQLDLFEFFWRSCLGACDCAFAGSGNLVNKSFTADQVEMVRQLNAMYVTENKQLAKASLRIAYRESIKGQDLGEAYQAFVRAFDANAVSLRVPDELPLISSIYRDLAEEFGSLIVNRHSDKQIMKYPIEERQIKFGSRDWLYRSDQTEYVRSVYTKVMSQMKA